LFKVIKHFTDMQDGNFAYDVGDEYPRKGMSVLPSRIKELATDKNRQGVPLIEEIPDVVEAPEKKTKSTKKADKE
jgi:hypothetical protein